MQDPKIDLRHNLTDGRQSRVSSSSLFLKYDFHRASERIIRNFQLDAKAGPERLKQVSEILNGS